jgi:hypothetical protein
MSTRNVVSGYYRAWTARDLLKARSFLADDLKVENASQHFYGADDFARALEEFVESLVEVRPIADFYSTEDAVLLYDCVTADGTVRTAEYFRVRGGKIREIKLLLDATGLRRLTVPQTAASVT